MLIRRSTILDVSAERAWAALRRPELLAYVARPIQAFHPVDPPLWPVTWADGRYQVKLRLFGLLPMGEQWIVIETPAGRSGSYRLRDNGHGDLVRRWDHLITIDPLSGDRCRYTDQVEVRAGLLTPFVAAFAWIFYRHRQRRWRRLVSSSFTLLGSGEAI